MVYLPCLFCQRRDNPVLQCFPRSSVAREEDSSLGINTIRANTQVLVALIAEKSASPFRQAPCNHWPSKEASLPHGASCL